MLVVVALLGVPPVTAGATLPPIVLALATGFLLVKLIQRQRTIRPPFPRSLNPTLAPHAHPP